MKITIPVAALALSTMVFPAAAQKSEDSTSQHNTAAPDTPPAPSPSPAPNPPARVCPVFVIDLPHKTLQEEEQTWSRLDPGDRFDKACLEKYIREFNGNVEGLKKELKKCLAGGKPPFPTKQEAEQTFREIKQYYNIHVASTDSSGCRRPLKR
jgi:hypothetical protein